jgi:hypothetical protein
MFSYATQAAPLAASWDSKEKREWELFIFGGELGCFYIVPKATDDFIVNNEKKKHSSYGMKSFIP